MSDGYDTTGADAAKSTAQQFQFQPSASSDNIDFDFDEESSTLASAMEGLSMFYSSKFIDIRIKLL
jgi:hypothetical protein